MLKRILGKKSSTSKRSKPAAIRRETRAKMARVAAKGGTPHSERAKPSGTTPVIASSTKAAVARKQAAARKRAAGGRKKPSHPGISAGEAEAELRRLRSARRKLERQLTAAVQEIGLLRQYEVRSRFLEAEVARRDGQLAELRQQYEGRIRELESRGADTAAEPVQGRLI
ncbi:MAG: hypothetical protein ACREQ9_14410 [Candidatus Binatia bacterium]